MNNEPDTSPPAKPDGPGRKAGAALVVASLMALTACGEDGAATPSLIEVAGVDYGYEGLPATIAAGSEIVFSNESADEAHEFVALRLADDDTRTAGEILALPPEELGPLLADVSSVLVAAPEGPAFLAEGSATLDEPGRYVVMCLIPTGADPDEYLAAAAEAEGGPPDVAGGPPHFVEGMWAELVVE